MVYEKIKFTLHHHQKRRRKGKSCFKIVYKGRRKKCYFGTSKAVSTTIYFLIENNLIQRDWIVYNPTGHFVALYEIIL